MRREFPSAPRELLVLEIHTPVVWFSVALCKSGAVSLTKPNTTNVCIFVRIARQIKRLNVAFL